VDAIPDSRQPADMTFVVMKQPFGILWVAQKGLFVAR